MRIVVVSNVADKFEFEVEPELTVGESKSLFAAMILEEAHLLSGRWSVKITFNGKALRDDEPWSAVGVADGGKVFVAAVVDSATKSCPTAQLPTKQNEREEARAAQQQMQALSPMIDMMASNGMFFEMMKAQSPELQEALKQNPELERELRNPETLKYLLRTQFDPDARREMNLSIQSQLAQINAIPGGAAMVERAASSLLRDTHGSVPRTAADLRDATEENSRPKDDQSANNERLPNPWARQPHPLARASHAPLRLSSGSLHGAPMAGQGNTPDLRTLSALFGGSRPASGAPAGGGSMTQPESQGPRLEDPASAAHSPLGTTGATSSPVPVPPATPMTQGGASQQYGKQLELLHEMGFTDDSACIDALVVCKGDVDAAVCFMAEREGEP